MIARLALDAFPQARLSEAHPKAARFANTKLQGSIEGSLANEHERDASIAALTAWAMVHHDSRWSDISIGADRDAFFPLATVRPEYWFPK